MTDARTLAYINLQAILGTIPLLCELDEAAAELIRDQEVILGISVKNGPSGSLVFSGGSCWFTDTCDACHIKLSFSSPEKFNGMIDGTVTPIPSKGFTRLGFLLKKFVPLTDILSRYLRATEEDLADDRFFEISTRLMFRVIAAAIACIGNEDSVGQASASYITDGVVQLAIGGENELVHTLVSQNHKLSLCAEQRNDVTAFMKFEDMRTARALFDGKLNAVAAVGLGKVRVGGMISQVDNINRILDRVALYLA